MRQADFFRQNTTASAARLLTLQNTYITKIKKNIMKQLKSFLFLFLASTLFWACSDDDTVNKSLWGDSYARFVRNAMTVTSTEGTAEAIIDWQQSTWEITLGEGNIVTNVTPTSGGDNNGEHQFTKVTLTCNANTSMDTRTQVIRLTDRNGTTTELTITQEWADKADDTDHLKPEHYADYADHLIKYINFMKQNGVDIYAVSVQNEPDMDFTAWTPQEVVNFLKQEGARIRETGVKLMSPEACGYQPEYTDAVLNDAEAFAQTDIVAGHLYQGFTDLSSSYVKDRHDYVCALYPRLGGKTWWMTEHLFNDGETEEDPSLWQFWEWDYNFSHLAKEIHMCMDGYCSAYVYWYLKRFYGMIGDTDERCKEEEGEVSKNGYILSHYARYATGTTRIAVTSASENIEATAYLNEATGEVTLVLLNQSDRTLSLVIPISGASQASAVETNETKNMEPADVTVTKESVSLPISGKSIVSVRIGF